MKSLNQWKTGDVATHVVYEIVCGMTMEIATCMNRDFAAQIVAEHNAALRHQGIVRKRKAK